MIKYALPVLVLTLLLILQVHNVLSFPVHRGFDIEGHLGYINYLKTAHALPKATQGYEMYQPPLYYFLASLIPSLSAARIINILAYFLIVLAAYWLAKFPGAMLVAILPISIYLTPPIGNEFFTAAMVGLTLVYYVKNYRKLTTTKLITLGILLGLCILSKLTAFALAIVIFIDLLKNDRRKIFLPLLLMILVGGWFYVRDFLLYRNPFVVNTDFPQFAITHSPAIRTLAYFFNLNGFLKLDLFNAHHYSFLAGTYFSWFFDGNNVVFPVQPFSKIGILLIILSLPIFLVFIYGLVSKFKRLSRTGFIMMIYLIIIFTAYVFFVFKISNYFATKSSYIASAIIPFAYFTVIGMKKFKKYYSVVIIYLFVYSLLIVKAFWIMPQWYK